MQHQDRVARIWYANLTLGASACIFRMFETESIGRRIPTMADKTAIKIALEGMDPDNAEHWLKDGTARMSVVEGAVGDTGITRGDVDAAWPGFTRDVLRDYQAAELEAMTGETRDDTPGMEMESAEDGEAPEPEAAPVPEDTSKDLYLPDEWGGSIINPKAGPVSASVCDDGELADDQVYSVWMEHRLYAVERTTTGVTPKFPEE